MNRSLRVLSGALLVLAGLVVIGGSTAARGPNRGNGKEIVPDELIVRFKTDVPEAQRDAALARVGAREQRKLGRIQAKLAKVDPAQLEHALKLLNDDKRVVYAEPNYIVHADEIPNDPSYGQLWGLTNTGQVVNGVAGTPDADIDADLAWGVTHGSSGVTVAVIDTGTDFSHPDLGGSMETSPVMWTNPGESCTGCRTNGVDDDGDGYVDDWRGWDFVGNDNNPQDDNGHGTHVSGTIGAIGNNGVGVAGVNWNVRIMALKFIDSTGQGTTAAAVSAITYATAHGAQIMSNSWGGGGFSQAVLDAIKDADAHGALFVAAAGNDAADTDVSPHYPSSYDVPNVISVAATNNVDGLASFSNYGRNSVDLGAPGVDVYSTVLGGLYDWYSGTSMATPHVSGAAALAKAAFPNASGIGLKALLLRTVDPDAPLQNRSTTAGRLNVNNAVRCAAAPKLVLDSPTPGFAAAVGESVPVRVLAASCADPAGVSVSVTANGAAVALTNRGDGLYTASVMPTQSGTLTIAATASVGAAADSASVSGNVSDNYYSVDDAFSWIDATAGGTNTGLLADDGSLAVTLPFAFAFYNQSFSSVTISTNGFLVFGPSAATAWSNDPIPSANEPNGVVAPLWDDLDTRYAGSIWYRTTGTAPNRRFTVEWSGVRHYSGADGVTFEATLDEGTNDVVFQYQDVNFQDPTYDYGAGATIGVERTDGVAGRQFSYNQALLQPYENAKALRFTMRPANDTTPPAAPLALSATGGDGSVSLDWADSTEPDLAGYRVYRDNGDGTWTQLASVATSAYVDGGLTNGTAYTYRVTAYDRSGNESAPSATASATPQPDAIAPAAPTGLVATAGDSTVALDWADNRETDLAGYRVYRRNADATWTQIAAPAASAYTDSGLTNDTAYTYRVTAVDRSGNESVPSASATATPTRPAITKAYQPTSGTVLSGSVTSGSLSSLSANDGVRLEVSSAWQWSAGAYVSDFYVTTTIAAGELATLRRVQVDYNGNTSKTATMTLSVYDWSTGTWLAVDGPLSVGSTDRSFSWQTALSPARYVSPAGEIAFRIRATRGGGFRTRTDLVRFTIDY